MGTDFVIPVISLITQGFSSNRLPTQHIAYSQEMFQTDSTMSGTLNSMELSSS
jgi:hypothetical protein